jgi:hypothetical protein
MFEARAWILNRGRHENIYYTPNAICDLLPIVKSIQALKTTKKRHATAIFLPAKSVDNSDRTSLVHRS